MLLVGGHRVLLGQLAAQRAQRLIALARRLQARRRHGLLHRSLDRRLLQRLRRRRLRSGLLTAPPEAVDARCRQPLHLLVHLVVALVQPRLAGGRPR